MKYKLVKLAVILVMNALTGQTDYCQSSISSSINFTQKKVIRSIRNDVESLTVGDKIPEIFINNILNHSVASLRLADFKRSLIILDFFATWCSPCVAELPKLQDLQTRYKDKIQILVITPEPERKVRDFLQTNKVGKDILFLPIIVEDKIFSSYFLHQTVPHEVWIYEGVVKAITTEQYVTSDNIKAVLDKKAIELPLKRENRDYDLTKSIFKINGANPVPEKESVYYSGFTGYINGPSPGIYLNTDSALNMARYNVYNLPIISIYSIAFDNSTIEAPKHQELLIKDSSRVFYNNRRQFRDQWISKYWYSYETVVPIVFTDFQMRQKLKADADYFFGFETSIQKQKTKCLILKSFSSTFLETTGELPRHALTTINNLTYSYTQKNEFISEFVSVLNSDPLLNTLPLIINESNYNKRVDLNLTIGNKVDDLTAWRRELKKYGLDLIFEERYIDILVIKEKKYN